MRYRLRPLYTLGGYGSAVCLCLICAMITAQICGRLLDMLVIALGGNSIGLSIPGLAQMSGFLLVGASFLGLAYTFVHGGHIRVTLVTGQLPPRIRVFVELWCLTIALTLCAYLAWYTGVLLADGIAFGQVSYGMVPVPLWIPQSAMLLGIALFCLALAEAWLATCVMAFTRPGAFRIDDDATHSPEP